MTNLEFPQIGTMSPAQIELNSQAILQKLRETEVIDPASFYGNMKGTKASKTRQALTTIITGKKVSLRNSSLRKLEEIVVTYRAENIKPVEEDTKQATEPTKKVKVVVDKQEGMKIEAVTKKSVEKVDTDKSYKPYEKFGLHGKNIGLEGYKKGDRIEFEVKGEKVVGEFRNFHINNHSPKGYVVIKVDGKYYERVVSKIKRVKSKKKANK